MKETAGEGGVWRYLLSVLLLFPSPPLAGADEASAPQIEATVRQLTGILRANKFDLEKSIGIEILQSNPIMTWLVEYVAWIITVRLPGSQRFHGRHFANVC